MKTFCSWSGGKDSALAFYEATRSGIEITHLLNMATENGEHSRTHGLTSGLLASQSEAINISLLQQKASWDTYEKEFKKALSIIKDGDALRGVFGDIDMIEHRDWVERVCLESGVEPILPLWLKDREEILISFIDAGFKAIVVATDERYLGEEWLGREINRAFIHDLKALNNVDLCGEKGEYHTFVYDGPIFKKPVEFNVVRKILMDSYRILELAPKDGGAADK
ncbi:MAG: diphthine--ammonia ligase [Proteobacteria bacterium]|nr:diphthine--ammonia ligase [Pseudomonadota bacterium]